jgi:hypothetical protein
MNVNVIDLTPEEAKAILADGRLILASREEVAEGQLAIDENRALRAHVERLRASLGGVLDRVRSGQLEGACSEIGLLLAATPAQATEANGEQDFWARMQGPLVHRGSTASTESSTAIEVHAKQLREALETLNHAAKVAISSQYGSSLDRNTPLVIRLLDGTCDATDAILAATPAQSLEAVTAPLKAHVERMRAALECIPVDLVNAIEDGTAPVKLFLSLGTCKLIGESLAATPAQSLAAVKAAALREVANLIRQTTPEPVDGVPESFGAHQGRMYAIEQIESDADRIEKEAANG